MRANNPSSAGDPLNIFIDPAEGEVNEKKPAPQHWPKQQQLADFGVYPTWLLGEIHRTNTVRALPLILATLRRMRMKRKTSIALTRMVWVDCGIMSEMERRSVLSQLKKIPHVMKLTAEHRIHWRYRLTLGEIWGNPPPPPEFEDED
jgi:hypothetical protein